MTMAFGFRPAEPWPEGLPDLPRAGSCDSCRKLKPALWRYGPVRDNDLQLAVCDDCKKAVLDAATTLPTYKALMDCPKWSKKPNPKHEHGKECLL